MDGDLKPAQPARLDGRVVYLVPFAESHVHDPAYRGWLGDREVMKTVGRPEYMASIPFAEIEAYARRLRESPDDMFFAVHLGEDDRFVGTAKAGHIDWRARVADIGVMIGARDQWARGLATDALATLCRSAFADLGMRRLVANIMAANPAMIRVFEKLGFQREGVRRQHMVFEDGFTDIMLYGCFAREFNDATAG